MKRTEGDARCLPTKGFHLHNYSLVRMFLGGVWVRHANFQYSYWVKAERVGLHYLTDTQGGLYNDEFHSIITIEDYNA